VERKIGNETYRVEKLPSSEGLKLLVRVTKILGPALRHLDKAFDANEGTRDAAAFAAFASIIETTDADDFQSLVVSSAERAQVKTGGRYEDVIFDVHFQGDLMKAFQVVLFVMEVQFKSFFDAARSNPIIAKIAASRQSS
jgi:hypothetical protein